MLHALLCRRAGEKMAVVIDSAYLYTGIMDSLPKGQRHVWHTSSREVGHRDLWDAIVWECERSGKSYGFIGHHPTWGWRATMKRMLWRRQAASPGQSAASAQETAGGATPGGVGAGRNVLRGGRRSDSGVSSSSGSSSSSEIVSGTDSSSTVSESENGGSWSGFSTNTSDSRKQRKVREGPC